MIKCAASLIFYLLKCQKSFTCIWINPSSASAKCPKTRYFILAERWAISSCGHTDERCTQLMILYLTQTKLVFYKAFRQFTWYLFPFRKPGLSLHPGNGPQMQNLTPGQMKGITDVRDNLAMLTMFSKESSNSGYFLLFDNFWVLPNKATCAIRFQMKYTVLECELLSRSFWWGSCFLLGSAKYTVK